MRGSYQEDSIRTCHNNRPSSLGKLIAIIIISPMSVGQARVLSESKISWQAIIVKRFVLGNQQLNNRFSDVAVY